METIDPNTRMMMMLLLLWVLLVGPSVFGSPLEIQLLDMMLQEAEGNPSNDRDQRDISVLPATSIGCDESGSPEDFSHLFEDYEESNEECVEFLPPCESSFAEGLPIEHPCFVKLLLLRTPLLKQDPCANFSLIPEKPITTIKPEIKKCRPKNKANKNTTEKVLLGLPNNGTESSTNISPNNSTTEAQLDSKIIKIRKLVPKSTTTTTTTSTTTTLETTTSEETTITEEPPATTTELEATTTTPTTTTTTSATTTTTQLPYTENQLKRLKALRNRRKNQKGNSPKVPDPPKIKLDNASQPSEVIQVIMTTEAAELRLKPEASTTTTVMPTTTVSTTTSEPETSTEESCEDDVETTKVPEFSGCEDEDLPANDKTENNVVTTTEEPCEDTDEQNTNLCPQFMPAQGSSAHQKPPPAFRFRKPVKNYVEPILYEGNFAKPLQRTAPIGPQQRDYFVSNKQIVPRPRPKYRKRIPPSIYMNNIVRGLDCSDEGGQYPPRTPNQPQRYWDVSPVDFSQRSQGLKKMRPEKNMRSFAPVPIKRQPFYPRSSEENMERQFLRERDTETQYRHYPDEELSQEERLMPPATPTPSLDPCQEEHDRTFYSRRPIRPQKEQLVDYPQPPISSHFFT
ncbi:proteoglycan 4 [Drosophila elegans]|uniref:proteoglycan 4 n=1 Tax=Drosophila elegans TaxID=30023 RepID=UPI0007E70E56|nr:proteoglycan 4 [Drosophila elegans]